MAAPSVYAAIHAIAADCAKVGIAKSRFNEADDYAYRSVDDLLDHLAPLLARHRLCVLPTVVKRDVTECQDDGQQLLFHVSVCVSFALVSVEDGSSHSVSAFGEALDSSDKATAKAISSAYKSAMIQTFCIPVTGGDDPDQTSPKVSSRTHLAEPVQGWEQWARDIEDIVSVCETEQAIKLVQEGNRELLKALSREQPDRYRELGECFAARRETLAKPPATRRRLKQRGSSQYDKGHRSVAEAEAENA